MAAKTLIGYNSAIYQSIFLKYEVKKLTKMRKKENSKCGQDGGQNHLIIYQSICM